MGFTNEVACRQALIQANNDIDKAIDILVQVRIIGQFFDLAASISL